LFQLTLLLHILFSIPVPSCGASYDSSTFYALGVGYLPVLGGYVLLEVPCTSSIVLILVATSPTHL
jgi:hypothetical protein